jgi:hypothetical protein
VNGPNQHALFKFLKATKGGIRGFYRDDIKWNFAKFVIGKDGVVIERFTTTTSPKMIEVGNLHTLLLLVCKLMRIAIEPYVGCVTTEVSEIVPLPS